MSRSRDSKEELRDAIIDLAQRNPVFRKALLEQPKLAVYEHFGVQIPETFRIRFIERDPALDALIVLPPLTYSDTDELTDQSLDAVAGGVGNPEEPPPDPEWPETW